jgi:hypothetical protein
MEYAAEFFPVVSRDEDIKIMRRMTIYESVGFDRERFIAAYYRHHADVRRYFAGRSDLLEMSIVEGEGWERLCPFLGLPTPDCAFPRVHKRP